LTRFAESHLNAPEQIEQLIQAGDQPNIFRFMHTLAGLSGNIGATEVHSEAQVLAERLRHGGWGQSDATSVRSLGLVVAELAKRMHDAMHTTVEDGPDQTLEPMPASSFRQLIDTALASALQNDPSAVEPLEDALRHYAVPGGVEHLRSAIAALHQMDFDEACAHLKEVTLDG
jgi:HPt (histidine-containing phosphotransfer) domain-containing protein